MLRDGGRGEREIIRRVVDAGIVDTCISGGHDPRHDRQDIETCMYGPSKRDTCDTCIDGVFARRLFALCSFCGS